ncbi:MAG: 1-deoxy-D-xylulose-5-phosphate reductoisomerase [Acidimicrobiia bacterium]|nr:1-deoxy-D-xylulose-5-phosphate reductoisomerase [Acidimicrobiia bacterium]
MGPRSVAVVGSTGSIGTQTLDVVARRPDEYRIVALAAGGRLAELAAQAAAVRPEIVAVGHEQLIPEIRDRLRAEGLADVAVVAGTAGLAEVSTTADVVVNGVVGFTGLSSTLAALNAGRRLALANKESLIAAGPVVQKARRTPGAELIPVDSEHAAIHQCLQAHGARPDCAPADGCRPSSVQRIQLTASGGPFRGYSTEQLASVSVEDALAHPTWSMGPKITVDSSTLMNKGLEVIEANELFGRPAGAAGHGIGLDDIEVVVHPQSIVHSMVTYRDGSTIAQLSKPDMRLPIAYALAFPDRFAEPFGAVDWSTAGRLDFEPPDRELFPCLDLAYEAGRIGGTAPAWISAANEVAVEAFLEGRLPWTDIAQVIERVMSRHDGGSGETLDEVLDADSQARKYAEMVLP